MAKVTSSGPSTGIEPITPKIPAAGSVDESIRESGAIIKTAAVFESVDTTANLTAESKKEDEVEQAKVTP